MNYECLEFEKEGRIAVVRLNRPEKRNALSAVMMQELQAVSTHLNDDTEIRVAIFTGNGKHFSGGADLQDLQSRAAGATDLAGRRRMLQIGPDMIAAMRGITPITIAAINGGAVGGGACIASALDFRVAASDAFISYPEIHLGMNLSWRALPLVTHLVGPARAKQMVIGGERHQADELREWGFVEKVAEEGQLMDCAHALAEFYAARPAAQSQMIKRSVNALIDVHDQSVMHMDADQFLLAALAGGLGANK